MNKSIAAVAYNPYRTFEVCFVNNRRASLFAILHNSSFIPYTLHYEASLVTLAYDIY
jgi:hypothetical protein